MTLEPRRTTLTFVCVECNQWLSVDDQSGEPGMCQSCFGRRAVKRLKGLQDELRDVVEAFIDRGTADDIERILKAVRGDKSANPGELIAAHPTQPVSAASPPPAEPGKPDTNLDNRDAPGSDIQR